MCIRDRNTVKLTLIVKEDATSYDFKPLPLYFNGNAAVAYGTPINDKINYNCLLYTSQIIKEAGYKITDEFPKDAKFGCDGVKLDLTWAEILSLIHILFTERLIT